MSLLDDVDDEAFLLAAEAAEAAAISSSKRPRLSTSPSPTPAASEGAYLSALKGSHSAAWKQQQETLTLAHRRPGGSKVPGVSPAGGVAGGVQITKGACFKCGDTSHWARECPQSLQASVGGVGGGIGGCGGGGVGGGIGVGAGGYVDMGGEVEEKACPCGSGICLVLTSSTPRNPGRKFYRCPARDNGGCNFFEWCDAPSPGPANARSNTCSQSDASIVNMPCSCGAGTCLILTTKAGVNVGRQFYRCPVQGGSSCGFFKWCDDQQPRTAAPLQGASSPYQAGASPTNQNMSKSSSGCFKCGQENHWAKDCPNQSSDPCSDKGGRTLSSATSSDGCFKCGKAGHWSRDCPVTNSGGGGGGGAVGSNVKSSSTLGSWNSRRY